MWKVRHVISTATQKKQDTLHLNRRRKSLCVCLSALWCYVCIMCHKGFIGVIKCYLLSWQVSEAGFPVKGVTHMQWATSKMSIHEDTMRDRKKTKRHTNKVVKDRNATIREWSHSMWNHKELWLWTLIKRELKRTDGGVKQMNVGRIYHLAHVKSEFRS